MADFYASYPLTGGGGGVPKYANLAAFPSAAGAGNGALAIALDTDILYISDGSAWLELADPDFSPNAITALTGDGTATGPGSVPLTLATVNSNVGAFGSASSVGTFTVNAKGLTTAAGSTSIQIAESQVTNLVTDLAGKVPVTRLINTTAPLTGGGDLSADRTLAVTSGDLTAAGTDGISVTTGTARLLAGNASIQQQVATGAQNGYLSSADWTTFNGKQGAGNYITALTGDVTASGPGSVAATLAATSNATLTSLSALTSASSLATVGTITSGTWNGTTIAIANGGTGQTSKTPAFDALAPTTTKGDLIVYDGTDNVRQAVGTDGQALLADSGQTTGVRWGAVLSNPMTTTGDIIYSSDNSGTPARLGIGSSRQVAKVVSGIPAWSNVDLLLTNSSATPGTNQTLTSSAAAAVFYTPSASIDVTLDNSFEAGRQINIFNKSSANTITLKANDASVIRTIYPNTNAQVVATAATPATNTDWLSLNIVVSNPTTYVLTIGGSSSAPTQGSGATKTATWWRDGGWQWIRFDYQQTNAGSAGSGTYLFPIATGTINSSFTFINNDNISGTCGTFASRQTSSFVYGTVQAYNSTNLAANTGDSAANLAYIGSSNGPLSTAVIYYSFLAQVPITGWTSYTG